MYGKVFVKVMSIQMSIGNKYDIYPTQVIVEFSCDLLPEKSR